MIYILLGIHILFWVTAAMAYAVCDGISKAEALKVAFAIWILIGLIALSAFLIIKGITSL